MLTFSPNLQAILNGSPNKLNWSTQINAAIGDPRRLRCKSTTFTGVDVWVAGTEFLNVAMTGALHFSSGNIVDFGTAGAATIQLSANLSVGSAVLRIEGNGYWLQGTLGLPGSDCDFIIPVNPTATSGIGFRTDSAIRAPKLLPSGTGPAVPALGVNAPAFIELEDWSDPLNPIVIGSIRFNTRAEDIVFEDAELAGEMGDIANFQSLQSIVFDKFEFGAQLYVTYPGNTEVASAPLYQVLVGCKPYGTWSTYPAMDTYVRANHPVTGRDTNNYPNAWGPCDNANVANTTFPNPFKIKIKRLDGSILHTYEMRDGLPINSPLLVQAFTDTVTGPVRPHFNCGMLLPWQSTRTKRSTLAGKYFNGMTSYALSPTACRAGDSVLAKSPILGGWNANSLNHLYAMPRWPMAKDFQYGDSPEVTAIDPQTDTKLFQKPFYHNYEGKIHRITGWDYEIGSVSGHDWYTGPGGPRFDRAAVPSVVAIWATDQSYVRPQGNVPARDLLEGWSFAYFNHSCHYLRDVKTFATIPDAESLRGDWCIKSGYYGSGPYGAVGQPQGPQFTVDMVGMGNGVSLTPELTDASGRLPWNGWLLDTLHSYCQPGWMAILLNSPMHVVAAKFRFNAQWMGALGDSRPDTNPTNFFMVRVQAWRWLHSAMMWKLATSHSQGFTRNTIETRFTLELETMWTAIYKPAFIDNVQSIYFKCVRNFGQAGQVTGDGSIGCQGGTLGLYMAHVIVLMKQFGMWDVMRAKNVKCQQVLDMMITCLDKFNVDWTLDTNNTDDSGYPRYTGLPIPNQAVTIADIPDNWAGVQVMLARDFPPTAPKDRVDWIHTVDGSTSNLGYEQYVGQHLRYQYLCARRDFFPEYANPRLTAAIAKMKSYYDIIAAGVADNTGSDWHYRYPAMVNLKPAV